MSDEQKTQRSASEVLLALETKVDILLQVNRSLDLNFKVLSNKFNQILQLLETDPMMQVNGANNPLNDANIYTANALYPSQSQPAQPQQGPITAAQRASIKVKDQLEIPTDMPLTIETVPVGFTRTSRPETHTSQEVGQIVKNTPTPSLPLPETFAPREPTNAASRTYPVQQRVTDGQGKSLFMCDVRVTDSKGAEVYKGRTNGVGKWSAQLNQGSYKVNVKKHDSIAKKTIDVDQTITIDSRTNADLPVLICK